MYFIASRDFFFKQKIIWSLEIANINHSCNRSISFKPVDCIQRFLSCREGALHQRVNFGIQPNDIQHLVHQCFYELSNHLGGWEIGASGVTLEGETVQEERSNLSIFQLPCCFCFFRFVSNTSQECICQIGSPITKLRWFRPRCRLCVSNEQEGWLK